MRLPWATLIYIQTRVLTLPEQGVIALPRNADLETHEGILRMKEKGWRNRIRFLPRVSLDQHFNLTAKQYKLFLKGQSYPIIIFFAFIFPKSGWASCDLKQWTQQISIQNTLGAKRCTFWWTVFRCKPLNITHCTCNYIVATTHVSGSGKDQPRKVSWLINDTVNKWWLYFLQWPKYQRFFVSSGIGSCTPLEMSRQNCRPSETQKLVTSIWAAYASSPH